MNRQDTCEIFCYNEEKVNQVQQDLNAVNISGAAKMLKADC